MANIRRISQIAPTLAFAEFDMIEKYRKSFERSELGHVHASFPFESFAKKMGLKEGYSVNVSKYYCDTVTTVTHYSKKHLGKPKILHNFVAL